MFITSHSQVRDRRWRTTGGGFGPIQERLAWAGQHFECAVELRGIASDASGTGEWRWSYVRAYVGPKSELQALPNLTYAHCRFRSEIVTLDEFLARAEQCQLTTVGSERHGQLREPRPFRIGDLEIPARLDHVWDHVSQTSDSQHCHWPCWAVYSSLTCERVWDPLVSSHPNHPLFFDYKDLLEQFGGLPWFNDPRDIRTHAFNVVVADQRGRITGSKTEADRFLVSLSGAALADLTLQVRCPGHPFSASVRSPGEVVDIGPLPAPCGIQAALVAGDDEFVDWCVFSVFPARIPNDLRELVSGGENEFVEFKPWTVAGEGEKFGEFVNTIIAMANGQAPGFLIVGLDNVGRPQWTKAMNGYLKDVLGSSTGPVSDRDSQRARRRTAAEHYAQEVLDKIQQKLTRCPRIDIDVPDFADGVVVRLKIFPHGNPPVRHIDTNEFYVRRGASNRTPTDDECLRLYARAQG